MLLLDHIRATFWHILGPVFTSIVIFLIFCFNEKKLKMRWKWQEHSEWKRYNLPSKFAAHVMKNSRLISYQESFANMRPGIFHLFIFSSCWDTYWMAISFCFLKSYCPRIRLSTTCKSLLMHFHYILVSWPMGLPTIDVIQIWLYEIKASPQWERKLNREVPGASSGPSNEIFKFP